MLRSLVSSSDGKKLVTFSRLNLPTTSTERPRQCLHNPKFFGIACRHYAPLACAVAVIRWRRDASSGVLRERARCTRCGRLDATMRHSGWGGADVGFLPFPVLRG
jgi:hypothetical protein